MKKHLLFFWALTVLLMPGVQSCDDSSEGGSAPAELTVTPNPLTVGADGGPQELSCLVENPNGGSVRASSSGATWIHSFDCSTEGKIFFYVDANPDYDLRTGEVIVTYEDAESVRLVVEQQGAEPPIGIRIEELTTTSARVTWEPDDASMTYILGVAERSVIDSYASGREMMEHDLEGFKADADSWGMSLSEYLEFGVLYTGKQVFPKDGFKPGTEYCAYAYGMDANGEFTTGLVKEIFETVAMTDCSFTIEPRDVTKNSVLLEVTPERNDVSYYVAYVERKAFENDFHGSDSELMQATVAQIRSNMALTGATWSDFVHLGGQVVPCGLASFRYRLLCVRFRPRPWGDHDRHFQEALPNSGSRADRRLHVRYPLRRDRSLDRRCGDRAVEFLDALLCDFHGVLYPRNAHAGRSGCYENQ